MFIKISDDFRDIPKIIMKAKNSSNIIKQSDLSVYKDAKELSKSLEEISEKYQALLHESFIRMMNEKEQILNRHVESLYDEQKSHFEVAKKEWLREAQCKFDESFSRNEIRFRSIESELKRNVSELLKKRLEKLLNDETLIQYLCDFLHNEMSDQLRELFIYKDKHEDGNILLTIENNEQIITIGTRSIIEELENSLDEL
ncbi:hypothetical protein [Vibrio coralliilyticus]|uniref:hypothetical protein n=1 Tax=Vibrio coralliilyticus TaxID=190893 RepID=UPI0017E20CB4|nr:hypothetical protein [Vibrio coralliilyticus]NUW68064.1 hypothetical protein [Vibrio coralliilyticus]